MRLAAPEADASASPAQQVGRTPTCTRRCRSADTCLEEVDTSTSGWRSADAFAICTCFDQRSCIVGDLTSPTIPDVEYPDFYWSHDMMKLQRSGVLHRCLFQLLDYMLMNSMLRLVFIHLYSFIIWIQIHTNQPIVIVIWEKELSIWRNVSLLNTRWED